MVDSQSSQTILEQEKLGQKPHVLVVDDDDRIRDLVSRYLHDHGFVSMCARDAKQAHALTERFVFDVLVVDVMMPGESGLEFTQKIQVKQNVPVLLLTALAEAEDRIKGLESGADDYLSKPFEPRELVLRLQSLLKRSKNHDKRVIYRVGAFEYDPANDTVLGPDGVVLLTDTESRLLKALASKPSQVFSREDLSEICGIEGGGRTIDVQVTRLRKKIEQDSKTPHYLQTVRGKGYRLHVEEI